MPQTSHDVVIVGARCAGAPLAALLARAGLRVAVLEQVTFPRTTLSSHLMEADGIAFLRSLGVIDRVRETGVRFMRHVDTRLDDLRVVTDFPLRDDDLGGAAFLRRHLLDAILAEAAVEAGADVRMATKVVGLIREGGRVAGVRALHEGRELELRAPLVVGADGRASTVAKLCGARRYNVTRNERNYYFTFFEGADPGYEDLFVFHRWGDRMVWAGAADSGLYLVGVSPEMHERAAFRRDPESNLMAHMRSCEPTERALRGARRATKIFGIVHFEGYFREAAGPGWVLVGDSGHFKDPSAGRGIGDAFIQVERLAPAIVRGLGGSQALLAGELARWAQWRDRKFRGHYWLANDLGCAGSIPTVAPEVIRRMRDRDALGPFFDLFSHRSAYYDVLTIPRLALATATTLARRSDGRRELAEETGRLLVREAHRRWINRRHSVERRDAPAAPPARRDPDVLAPAAAVAAAID